MKRLLTTLLALLCLWLPLAATGADRTPATVTGTVTFYGNGMPLYGASVNYGPYGSLTDTNGVYSHQVPEGVYTVTCHRDGYLDEVRHNVFILGGRTFTLDFVLFEFPYPPSNLQAERNGYSIILNWNYPSSAGQLGLQPAPAAAGVRSASPEGEGAGQRNLLGYRVWRFPAGEEDNPAAWTVCITNASYSPRQDPSWAYQAPATYRWAVRAMYSGDNFSEAAISNPIPWPTEQGTVTGTVTHLANSPLANALVRCGPVSDTTDASGHYSLTLFTGSQNIWVDHPAYWTHNMWVEVPNGQTVTQDFHLQFYGDDYVDSFESYADFSAELAPWTTHDLDLAPTYGMSTVDWPGEYQPGAFMAFNPSATVPPLAGADPFDGAKFAACFSATAGATNDWLVAVPFLPYYNLAEISFWARSYTDSYGLEKFRIGQAWGADPANMVIISGAEPVEVPTQWTQFSYYVNTFYATADRYGIQCVSDNAFLLMIDMVSCHYSTVAAEDPAAPGLKTALRGNHPNPFNPQTTVSFSLDRAQETRLEIFNLKGQQVKTLLHEIRPAGSHAVTWQGDDHRGRPVASGVYFCRMTAPGFQAVRKLLLAK